MSDDTGPVEQRPETAAASSALSDLLDGTFSLERTDATPSPSPHRRSSSRSSSSSRTRRHRSESSISTGPRRTIVRAASTVGAPPALKFESLAYTAYNAEAPSPTATASVSHLSSRLFELGGRPVYPSFAVKAPMSVRVRALTGLSVHKLRLDDVMVSCRVVDGGGSSIGLASSMRWYAHAISWESNEWLSLAAHVNHLDRSARLVFTLWLVPEAGSALPRPLGGTTISVFGKKGLMRRGEKLLLLWPGREGDPGTASRRTSTSGKFRTVHSKPLADINKMTSSAAAALADDAPLWMDAVTLPRLFALERELQSHAGGEMYLYVEFPCLKHPILYMPPPRQTVPSHVPSLSSSSSSSSSSLSLASLLSASAPAATSSSLLSSSDGGGVRSPGPGRHLPGLDGTQFAFSSPNRMLLLADPELGLDNPVDIKFAKQRRNGVAVTNLTHEQRKRVNAICNYPPTRKLVVDEKTFLWEVRRTLLGLKKAVPQLLAAVDWSDLVQANEAIHLISSAAIDIEDCMALLGARYRASSIVSHHAVRSYAVDCLRTVDDATLSRYLLQLVQGVRYELATAVDGAFTQPSTPLSSFLVERAVQSPAVLGSAFYWHCRVETLNPNPRSPYVAWYQSVMDDLIGRLERGGKGRWARVFEQQQHFFETLKNISVQIKTAKLSRKAEERLIRGLLAESLAEINPPLPLPLDPTVMLAGVIPSRVKVFKSAMKPILLPFLVVPAGPDGTESERLLEEKPRSMAAEPPLGGRESIGGKHSKQSSSSPASSSVDLRVCTIIYKRGDDLRQDQLVLQMIGLMDDLLKRHNLDLKLTPYRVMATSWQDGIMECVNAHGFQDVLKQYRSDLQHYLRVHQGDPNAEFGIKPEAIDTFVRSCAGSAVVTYLLGIGDRHLDNLMLTPQGHLFHIDFGFIMGREPPGKLPPGAMKFNKEMVAAMGGLASAHYLRFKEHCCEAYNILRKSANLILNLFALMADSEIPDIKFFGVDRCLMKLQDKFLINSSDADAASAFQLLINQSLTALGARANDLAHRIAQGLRS